MTKLMTDDRQNLLMKAAEDTIGLINIGVEPNVALAKVAADTLMNEAEIDLVAHATNNSRQLAVLQTAEPKDREKPFALVDAQKVKSLKLEPETNAETSTEGRYGLPDLPAAGTVAKIDAPDAVAVGDKERESAKKANYHDQAQTNHAQTLRVGWGLKDVPKFAEERTAHVWADEQRRMTKLSAERQTAIQHETAIYAELDGLNVVFRSATAPKFAEVEQAAQHQGVQQDLLNLVYDACGLDALNCARCTTKFAGQTLEAAPDVLHVLTTLGRLTDHVAKWAAANERTSAYLSKAAADAAKGGASKGDRGDSSYRLDLRPDVKFAPLDVQNDTLSGAGQSMLGLSDRPADDAQAFLGSAPTEGGAPRGLMDVLSSENRQMLDETGEHVRLKRMLQDKYIGGHSMPEVLDAYNSALDVNPRFGDAELNSYIRQHLATKGGVPLDLQIRARGSDE